MKRTQWSLIIGYLSFSKNQKHFTLGLLTILGVSGIICAANADELPLESKIDEVTAPDTGEENKSSILSSLSQNLLKFTPNEPFKLSETEQKPSLLKSDAIVTVKPKTATQLSQSTESQPVTTPTPPTPAPPTFPTLGANEVRILSPQTGVSTNRTTNLVVQYNPTSQIQVNVNGKAIDPGISTQQQRDEASNLITQVWYNIPLENGENTLSVQAGNGTPVSVGLTVKKTTAQIEITPVGDPRIPADGRSNLTINGKIVDEKGQQITEDSVVTLTASAGKFIGADYDKDALGFQVLARGGIFTAQLQSGVEAQKVRIRAAVDKIGTRTDRQAAGSTAPREGLLNPNFQPPNPNSQSQNIQSPNTEPQRLNNTPVTPIEAYTQVEFVTNLRPSLVTGSVNVRLGRAGTNFWGRRSEFLNPNVGDGAQLDVGGAVFATGKLGDWLFTGAYNSDRNLNETCDGTTRLFRGAQACDQQYPVYGDSSTVDYLTPSTDSLYLRFERSSRIPGAEPDYVMWGDYNTQEFARASQLFTATTRQLHGFKGNYNFGNLQVTAIYSQDIQGFQRDTIQPNGTSGYYFVSKRRLVAGSENVFVETEELNRPGTVVERKPLSRGPDYEIDYDRGTLLFRRPVLATEFQPFGITTATGEVSEGGTVLVRRIVVTYQYENTGGGDTNLYAGRLQYNISQDFNSQSWLGATYLRQDQGTQDFELYGADFLLSLGKNGQFIGEYAHSFNNSLFLGGVSGSAYRFEVNANVAPAINARAYYRSVEENFSNNATTSFTPGQTRYGAAATAQLGSSTRFVVGYDHEVNFGTAPAIRTDFFDLFNPGVEPAPGTAVNNSLTTIRAGIEQQFGSATLGVDYVNRDSEALLQADRNDRVSNVFSGNASQIVSRLGLPITEALTFRAQNELNLGSGNDPLYPNRTTLGLDWRAYPGVTMRLAHQFFDGGILGNNSITSLDTIIEQKISENTSVTGRYSVISAFNGVTGQGAVGLNHRWIISPGLRATFGYEHTFSNSNVSTAAGTRFSQPYAVGQSAASLALLGGDVYSVGVEYTDNPNFQASGRIEHRSGSGNDNTVFSVAGAGKLTPALTALARYEQANFANQGIEGLGDSATLRMGLAYRDPNNDKWNALFRYEYRKNPYTIPDTLLIGSGTGSQEHVLALEAIYAPSWRWELYGKGAFRYSNSDLAQNFSNSSSVYLSQLRASYKLGYQVDLAVEGRWIGQSSPGYNEFGVAVETGYYLTPDLRIGVGYSFGSVDDRDFTGYRSKDGPYLSLNLKVNELFGGFGRQRVAPRQQREANVEKISSTLSKDLWAQLTAPISNAKE